MSRCAFVLSCCLAAAPALAWWGDGHALLTRAAVLALPGEVPPFFRAGAAAIAAASRDADLHKNGAVPALGRSEHSEHFLDVELLGGEALPAQRYAFAALCRKLGVAPERVGFAPYAAAEWTGRLTMAFAEYRQWPDDENIQAKCLVYAGFVAHYAEDLAQPLHTTVHYDGKRQQDGTIAGRGIHGKVDAAVERLGLEAAALASGQEPSEYEAPVAALVAALRASHAQVERVYVLDWSDVASGPVRAFVEARARAAVELTASLYWTAWKKSAQVRLPAWLSPLKR